MHPRTQAFLERAEEAYGLDLEVREFPEGTKTAEDAADAVGCDVAQIASSIVVDVAGDLVVCITSGANRVDMAAVAAEFGADPGDVSMADADDVAEVVGWSIGGVPPICHDTDLPTLVDPTLLEYDTVWGAAGTPTSMFHIDPESLREYADARPLDVTE